MVALVSTLKIKKTKSKFNASTAGECLRSCGLLELKQMGIANYTNLSELMNDMLKTGRSVSISNLVQEAEKRKIILAAEGTMADKSDLENGFIDLVDQLYRMGAIRPDPASEAESYLIRLYESGKLAENGFGGDEGDRFIKIKWKALADNLPVIANLTR